MIRHAKATSAFTLGRSGSAAVLLALAALLFLFPVAAHAAPKGVVDDFGSQGSGNGQFNGTSPVGLAVNQNGTGGAAAGDVYAVDPNNNRVQRFSSTGTFLGAFGSTGTGKGQFQNPRGVAIDQATGAVYVTDQTNRRVQKFSATGTFERMWGWGVLNGAAEFQICTSAQTCQAGANGNGAGAFGSTFESFAIEPVTGDVYVGDATNRRIQVFDSSGNFLRAMGWDVSTGGIAGFETCTGTECRAGVAGGTEDGRFGSTQPVHLAIDSSGPTDVLFASDSNLGNRVQRIDITAPAAPVAMSAIGSAGAPLLEGSTSGLAIDPATNNLLVARDPASGETVIQELTNPANTAVPLPAVIDSHATGEGWGTTGNGSVTGIAVRGSTGSIYVSRPGLRQVAILNAGTGPTTSLDATTAVGATGATLNATINPNGAKTYYQFQYRAVGGGSFTNVPATLTSAGNGASSVNLTAPITGLLPGVSYEVQLLVDGYGAPQTVGTDTSGDFSTPAIPPTVSDRPAAPVTDTTAVLQAELTPNNAATTYFFQYISDASFKANGNSYAGANAPTQIPAVPAVLPAGMSPVVVFEQVAGLAPETAYHFRVVANNGTGGNQTGADRTFVTEAAPGSGDPDLDRGYELVSPAYKEGGQGVGYWYRSPTTSAMSGFAATEGERFMAQAYLGGMLMDGAFGYGNDWAAAERINGQVGWVSHSQITRGGYGGQTYRFFDPYAASSDLSYMHWSSGVGLARIFPEMESWSEVDVGPAPFVSDWEGRWELLAPDDPSQVVSGGGGISFSRTTTLPAARGPYAAISTRDVRGLAGAEDPTLDLSFAVGGVGAVFMDDFSSGVTDTFPGGGKKTVASVCSGASGVDRTLLPARLPSGKLGSQECAPAPAGRSERLTSPEGAALQRESLGGELSADGSRLFFLSPDFGSDPASCDTALTGPATKCPAALYVRQRNTDGTFVTRWISQSEVANQDASLMGEVVFEYATPDGDKVYFRTRSPLTADDPNGQGIAPPTGGVITGTPGSSSNESWDLYVYDLPDGPDGDPATADADPAGGELTRVSGGPGGAGDCNSFDPLRAASEDGARALFACAAPLAGVPAPDNGTITAAGGSPLATAFSNHYSYAADGGTWEFVARLPRGIEITDPNTCATSGKGFGYQLVGNSATPDMQLNRANCYRGTADGAFVTFATTGRLVAGDPDATSNDIYGFDAEAGELVRITSPQGGVGGTYPCNTSGTIWQCWGDGGIGGGTGTMKFPIAALGLATHPVNPSDRIAFFESKSRLVPEDEDTLYDVYEWRNGKLSLVSTGSSTTDGATYRGNSADGVNVYFATLDRLSWQDFDAALDVYTARAGGGIPEPALPPACDVLADGCQNAPATPKAAAGAASAVFAGGGNVAPPKRCPKGKVRKGNRCVKKSKSRPGKKRSGRAAGADRRAH